MVKKIQLICLALLIPVLGMAQTKLLEKVERKGNELIIPYAKYQLDNGLTLIIHEDHSDPIVHVDVTYHVGSAREELSKSGFAHFFEHMMFQGSDNVADEEHFKFVTEAGGTLNGTTNRDRTNYFETLPKNQLATGLWLEADRMGFLLDAVTQKKFEVQRATVKNERGQSYDNRPYGLAYEARSKNLYPYGHPYSWMTIGYIEDLNRVDVGDLKNFFLRWYGPNNATLSVGGDVDPEEVIELVEKYFGSIPRGPEVEDMPTMMPTIEEDRYVSFEDKYIRMPQLYMVWPAPPSYTKESYALDALAEIIGQGNNSILYQNLVKTRKALFAYSYNSTSELAGEFTFIARPFPGNSLADMETAIRAAIEQFEETGVSDDALQRYKSQYESGTISSLSSVSGKVSQLAAYNTFTGNPNFLKDEYEWVMSLTKEDIMAAYEKYIKGKSSLTLSYVPKGQLDKVAKPDNYTIDKSNSVYQKTDYSGLTYNKPVDNFDRSQKPAPGENPALQVPEYWTAKLKNGLEIIGVENNELPMVNMLVTIDGGHLLSANDPEKAGIASMTFGLMGQGTERYTAEQFSSELDKLGSNISVGAGTESTTVFFQSMTKNLDPTLELLEEVMYKPAFNQEDFDRVKKQRLENIKNQNTQPGTIASKVYNRLLYGDGHIRSIPSSGTKETVENIELDDVKAFYNTYFSPSVARVVIVGAITKKEALAAFKPTLEKWEPKEVEIPELKFANNIDQTKIYLVDVPGSAQAQLRVGYLTDLAYSPTGEYYKRNLMNYPLGGAFNSRINLNLREDKGYTYGARSYFSGSYYPGAFTVSTGVKIDVTDSALAEIIKELDDYATNGVTEDELAFMKSSMGQRDARAYETAFQKAGFLGNILKYDLDKDFVDQQQAIMRSVTAQELGALAKEYLPTDKMNILVVGDKKAIKDKLARLGYPIIELNAEGTEVLSNPDLKEGED